MIKYFLVYICLFLFCSTAVAVERWGKISKGVTYDRLSIEQLSPNKCKMSIEIENNSKKEISSYRFKMTALDIHKSIDWSVIVTVKNLAAGAEKTIKKTIKNCKENNPYKIRYTKKK